MQLTSSESVCDHKEKNNLFICNMMTYSTRKVLYEKLRVHATVSDCNLRTPQETMCRREIYNALW